MSRVSRLGYLVSGASVLCGASREARADDDEVRVRGQRQSAGFSSTAKEGETPRETTDAASLAETLPGVHVRRLGADDGFATLSIRGSGSSQVAVSFAGVPLTGGSDPTLDLGSLPVWPGVRIRAHRTFSPASFGPGSLGGALVLEPPPASSEKRTEAHLAVGSLGVARMRLADARPLGEGQVVSALSASRSDDEFDFFFPAARGGAYVRRRNAGHAQASALVSVVQPASWKGSTRVTLLAQSRRQELPGTALDPTPFDRLDTTRLLPVLELRADAGRGTFRVRAHGRRDEESLSAGPGSIAVPHRRDAFIAAGTSLGWRGALSDDVRVDVTLDGSGERYAPGTTPALPSEGARRLSTGVGLDLDWQVARTVVASVATRADTWRDEGTGDVRPSRSDVRPTGHGGLEWQDGIFSVAAHGGTTARPPAFLELFGNRGAFLPNPSLSTESAWTVDLGGRATPRVGPLRVDLSVSGFSTFASDLITFVPVGAFGRARADNIGRARIVGVEAELGARVAGLEVRAVYTGLDTENQGQGACSPVLGRCERPPLPGRPAHDFVGDVAYRFGRLRLRYGFDWVSGIAADLQGTVNVPPRALQSVGARLEIPGVPGQLTANVEVRNLFDLRVVEYRGVTGPVFLPVGDAWAYPLPGRTALATLRFRY